MDLLAQVKKRNDEIKHIVNDIVKMYKPKSYYLNGYF